MPPADGKEELDDLIDVKLAKLQRKAEEKTPPYRGRNDKYISLLR